MRKNFTREPANPRERLASSARLPAASVSCAIPYAALGEATTAPAGLLATALADRSAPGRLVPRERSTEESRESSPVRSGMIKHYKD